MGRHPEPVGWRPEPVGVVLAGGLGRRIGGGKAIVELGGRPLIAYPLGALRAVLDEVVVVAKEGTALPSLPGTKVWTEPDAPRHPLAGIIHALRMAAGRAVLVCAGDLPFVTPLLIERIVGADPGKADAVMATCKGAVQPLLGCYEPGAAKPLASALAQAARGERLPAMRQVVSALGPRLFEVDPEDGDALFNVNSYQDLVTAEAMLADRPTTQPSARTGRPLS